MKKSDGYLKQLREYIADEARRLDTCGGKVHVINLDEVDDEGSCLIPTPTLDPLECDLDELFGSSESRKKN